MTKGLKSDDLGLFFCCGKMKTEKEIQKYVRVPLPFVYSLGIIKNV